MLVETIYFVQFENSTGPIKIGYTTLPIEKRLGALQTGCPGSLSTLKTIQGDKTIEHKLHKKFRHLNIQGEWFRPGKDLLDYIEHISSYFNRKQKQWILDESVKNKPKSRNFRKSLLQIDKIITKIEDGDEKKFILEGRLSMENIIQNKRREWGLV